MLARSSFVPPTDLKPYVTADGSVSLRSAALQEGYHSVHGALQESRHVFIQHGLCAVDADPLHILEVGLGTGLNLLLTLADTAVQGRSVGYVALEPFPPPVALVQALDHPTAVGRPDLRADFDLLMDPANGDRHGPRPGFTVERRASDVLDLREQDLFHLVYFDAFGPRTQPGIWTAEVFGVIHRAMAPGGVLVTYCAKGEVRRTLQGCGFRVERLQGPPGKREMLRARKPLSWP